MISQKEMLRKYGIRPVKRRGQNFLVDGNMARAIAQEIFSISSNVLELGAGGGAITFPLLEAGASVTAVEVDRNLCEILRAETGEQNRFRLIEQDLAKLEWKETLSVVGKMPVIAGNLPYVLTSEVLFAMVDLRDSISGAHFMMQFEVAERMVAKEGSKDFGILSIILGSVFDIELVRSVPPSVFWPQPKVNSALVVMKRNSESWSNKELDKFRNFVKMVFVKRRKKIGKIVRDIFNLEQDETIKLLELAGIDINLRPEQISRELFRELVAVLPEKEDR